MSQKLLPPWLSLAEQIASSLRPGLPTVSLIASCALHGIEPWAYLRDVLILLPTWPPERFIELAPKFWKQTLEHADARQRLAASPWPRAPAATPS
ncbi:MULTISPECIES: transposase domain-containing protein [Sorangium]|uniref:transposase domain-containing protein n=1 Tax=Sorangium TaxID=39643 RepID=UPI003D9C0DF8